MKSFLPSSIILYFHHHHHLSPLLLMSLIKYSECTYQTFSTSHIGSARGLQTSFSSREWQGCSLSPWCRSSGSAERFPPPSGPRTAPAGRLHSPHTWKWSRSVKTWRHFDRTIETVTDIVSILILRIQEEMERG